jgi:SAM-dependent methyltransferase
MSVSKPEATDYLARHENFERWFQTPLGRALLADQRCMLDHELQRLTGARQLQVGISHRLPLATGTDFSQKIIVTPRWYPHIPDGVAICDADELPFPGDSMDLVVLHHTADFSPYPHEVLREAARVLRGEGTIALTGFNPVSLWGVRRFISRNHQGPWGGRFMLRSRMEDWLRLLGFSVERSVTRFFRLPVQRSGRSHCSQVKPGSSGNRFLPGGAYYCILAKKRVYAGIPRRKPWRKTKVITLPGSGAVGASRGCSRQPLRKNQAD